MRDATFVSVGRSGWFCMAYGFSFDCFSSSQFNRDG